MSIRTYVARKYGLNIVICDGLGGLDSRTAPGRLCRIGYGGSLSTFRVDYYEILTAAEAWIYLGTLVVSAGADRYFHFFSL
jgi:hypothetical protein